MKPNKIVLAGGTGFIGSYLAKKFKEEGYKVFIISRSKYHINWNDTEKIIEALDGAELLINLTGKSVDCRYTHKNKWKILTSRTESTLSLHKLISKCATPPKMWMNSSTATIYRHAEDLPMTEDKGEIGSGFSVHVAESWENAFFSRSYPETKQVALRIAIVLGEGGALVPLKRLTKMGFGGKQGKGNQMMSWIHIEDLFQAIRFIKELDQPENIYNCAAPNPIANVKFMGILSEKLKMKIALPTPKWMLEFGAVIIRTEPEMVLKSRWVIPERLQKSGFEFKYPSLDKALNQLFKK